MTPIRSKLSLASPYQDKLVLQRGRSNVIWGWDIPGQRVALRINDDENEVASALTQEDGRWSLDCPELEVGGPYRLSIVGSSSVTLHDVLVGEVWLASGQSNMELRLSATENAELEIAQAEFPQIRMFIVGTQASDTQCSMVEGEWFECHPDTVEAFSAVGYFFARALHEALGVPVGILNASWGGTPVEAWASADALRQVNDIETALAQQRKLERDAPQLQAEAERRVLEWERTCLPPDPGNTGFNRGWASPGFDDSPWPSMRVPSPWQARGLNHNGVVWFRRSVDLPPDWLGCELCLTLGAVDDFDETYFNGVRVGSHPKGTPEAYRIQRRYIVPKELVQSGRAVVAVRVFDHFGEGGLLGPAMNMRLAPVAGEHPSIVLSGDWKYQVEHAIETVPATVFQTYPALDVPLPQYRLSALFNGMIAPLIPYGIRGAIWYQGESNVEQHKRYRERLVALIRDWRSRFGVGQFPFYQVQLASFRGGDAWPYLREAQVQSVSEPNTGIVVTLDIGEPDDIHPRNKRDVGKRLAALALSRCYGMSELACDSPRLRRVEIRGREAFVEFMHAEGLTAGDEPVAGFELAGSDKIFHSAVGVVIAGRVRVWSENVARPMNVRYAWSDAPQANLRNAAGLPAAPFRTDGY